MKKGEFPKIKKSTFSHREAVSGEDQPRPSPDSRANWPAKLSALSAIILIAQLALFSKSCAMYQELKTQAQSTGPAGSDEDRQKSRDLINNIEEIDFSKKSEKPTLLGPQMIADFNQNNFLTNFNTRFYPAKTGDSASILKLKLDGNERFGSFGNSLSVDYDFTARPASSAFIDFDLPIIDIVRFQKLSFRLLASEMDEGSSDGRRIAIRLISTSGDVIERQISELFTFWKKYEANLWQNAQTPKEFLLKQIRITVFAGTTSPQGTWYLDDMVLE